ncbi:hypothetical protein [uncultured Shewanella sp.]|uniref:hypothetical protein n=1 Tax=uncultured Shewanella sp. TaxID=173975 RepID=UPI0026383D46|nr:hypothetical protein [uncultured Shewanella sp.]
MPKTLDGLQFLFSFSEEFGHFDPDPMDLIRTNFKKHTFEIESIKNDYQFIGEYYYIHLGKGLAKLTARQILGNEIIRYSIAFSCNSNGSGFYIYSQMIGPRPPNIKQNIGSYVILNL